jgi:ATP adenylyltransferase/5',5'''-P-1,P-4-tetraphosphate phosphorylase II
MMAFYNGGEGAGASQTWRHLQCIEVPSMEGAPIEEWVEDLEVERKGQFQNCFELLAAGTDRFLLPMSRRQTLC